MTNELSEADISRILSAVETIETSIGLIVEQRDIDREEYHHDQLTQDVIERRFVKMTEAAIDIGKVLLRYERGEPVESNPGSMKALTEDEILSPETAAEMANAARFRNVLAHTYGDVIDADIVYEAAHDLERYQAFLKEIRAYLDSIGALDS
jgi:uncharacterized protein YutE (UPF0331/DUF86 family)